MPLREKDVELLRSNGATDEQIALIAEWQDRVRNDPKAAGTPEFIAFTREHHHLFAQKV